LTPEDELIQRDSDRYLDQAIDKLRPRQGLALRLRYGLRSEPMTFNAMAERYGVTTERARQITLHAQRCLRWHLKREYPEKEAVYKARSKASTAAENEVVRRQNEVVRRFQMPPWRTPVIRELWRPWGSRDPSQKTSVVYEFTSLTHEQRIAKWYAWFAAWQPRRAY
jgi:hypothetical protein